MKKHKEDLATKLENLDTTRLAKWLASMIGIGIVLLAGLLSFISGNFEDPLQAIQQNGGTLENLLVVSRVRC